MTQPVLDIDNETEAINDPLTFINYIRAKLEVDTLVRIQCGQRGNQEGDCVVNSLRHQAPHLDPLAFHDMVSVWDKETGLTHRFAVSEGMREFMQRFDRGHIPELVG